MQRPPVLASTRASPRSYRADAGCQESVLLDPLGVSLCGRLPGLPSRSSPARVGVWSCWPEPPWPSLSCYGCRGTARLEARAYDLAVADFSEAIRLAPKYAKAYRGRGQAYAAKGDAAAAGADLKRARSLDPGLGE